MILFQQDEQYSEIVGQRVGLSSIDIMKINIMYDCWAESRIGDNILNCPK